jgi:CRISPR system Cascade subunit CasD
MDFLVFRIYAPMASWGEEAVGGTRPSATYPGRSAILGLLAGALGIPRRDEARQSSLGQVVEVAVKEHSPGIMVRDYHTTQVPGRSTAKGVRSRRDELAVRKDRLNTILSTREYRCDGYWIVAIRLADASPWTLSDLEAALRRPGFIPFLGRKSCPLAAPLDPRVVSAAGIREALSINFSLFTGLDEDDERRRMRLGGGVLYAWEGEGGDIDVHELHHRHDQPLSRGRWQFTSRPENRHRTRE